MTIEQRVDVIEREGDRIIELATPSNLERGVPGCPGWNYLELVRHVARVYNWAGTIVEGQLREPPDRSSLAKRAEGDADTGDSAVDWLSDRLAFVTAAIRTTPSNASIWNFGPQGSGGPEWWARRQMNETIIHRVDAEASADHERSTPEAGPAITPVEAGVAADILNEVFEFDAFTEVEPDDLQEAEGMWVHLHATDIDGAEWTLDTGSRRLTRAHMKGDVALRGPAWALARWLWGRLAVEPGTAGELEVFGDVGAVEARRRSLLS